MAGEKGVCQKHGREFLLTEGCPLCLAEKRGEKVPTIEGELKAAEGTAMIPQAGGDMEVVNYYSQAVELRKYAEGREIKTSEDMKVANDDMTIIARLKKAMETKRKEAIQPHQDKVKEINGNFKFLMEPIEAADQVTREKMMAYNQEQLRRQREQEEINRKRMEAARQEAALNNGVITESVNLVQVVEAPKRVSTDMGTTGMVDNWKYEVVDFAALPDEYKVADHAMLNRIAKTHHDQKPVPGVRFYNEPTVRVTPK